MKKEKRKKAKQDGFFKGLIDELISSILFEIVWNILMFIPRTMIRLLKEIW